MAQNSSLSSVINNNIPQYITNHNYLNDQISNLISSISVNSTGNNSNNNEIKHFPPGQVHLNRTSSTSVINTYNNNNDKQSDQTDRIEPNNNLRVKNESTLENKKGVLNLGNYLFFEPESVNDTFGNALNTKTNQIFYWKKFDRRDYMKKLETYFIMENAERIFGFKEILFDSSRFGQSEQFAYVIFNQFYGDLHSYMKEKKRLDESEAKHIFRQCVDAVNDCHQNGIIVRDIKLKKFVFTDPEKTKIALTNSEDCLVLDDDAEDDLIKSQQGCPAYVSPEVLNTSQLKYSGKLSDSWSLGIVLFTLLLGRYPFHHQNITTMFAKIARAKFQIPPSTGLSIDAKTLLRSLIRLKPSERLLPSEIISHNWLKQNETNLNQLKQNKFKNLNSAYHYLNNLSLTLPVSLLKNQNNNQVYHKPLGISRSSPPGTFSLSQQNNQNFCSSQKKIDGSDHMVPEFTGPATTGPVTNHSSSFENFLMQ